MFSNSCSKGSICLFCFLYKWMFNVNFTSLGPAYLVVLCEEELVVIDLVTKEQG